MFIECTHILDSGNNCKSPAVRGTSLCFQHTPHERPQVRRPRESEPLELPNLHNKSGILVAVTQVVFALAERRIQRSEADTLLHCLKFAARLMTELELAADSSPVAFDGTQYSRYSESAEHQSSCEPKVGSIAAQTSELDPLTAREASNSRPLQNEGAPSRPHPISARITPSPGAAWVGSNEPRLTSIPNAPFDPILKSAGIGATMRGTVRLPAVPRSPARRTACQLCIAFADERWDDPQLNHHPRGTWQKLGKSISPAAITNRDPPPKLENNNSGIRA
jgi:hypothetical protein